MNTETGELIRLMKGSPVPEGYTEVPEEYADEANRLIREQIRAQVDMTKDTPLVRWAKKEADIRAKRKTSRKNSATSRRRNRK